MISDKVLHCASHSRSESSVREEIDALRLAYQTQPASSLSRLNALLTESYNGAPELYTELMFLRASCHQILQDRSHAEADITQAFALWQDMPVEMPVGLNSELHLLWAELAVQQGEIRLALERCVKSLGLGRRAGEPAPLAHALNKTATIFIELGDYTNAEPYLVESLQIAQDAGLVSHETFILNNIAVIKGLGGRNEEAAHYFELCADRHREANSPIKEVRSLANLANTYADLKQFERAHVVCREAIHILESLSNCTVEPWIRAVEAHLHRETGNWEAADTAAQVGIERANALNIPRQLPILLAERGLIAYARKEHHIARDFLEQALTESERMNRDSVTVDIYLRLSEVCEAQEDFAAAFRYFKHYHEMSQAAQKVAADRRLEANLATLQVERALLAAESARKEAEILRAHQEHLERLSQEDPLTGLYNRRYMDAFLTDAFQSARTNETPLSIAIFDLDNFKKINDRFSHQVGDYVLKETAHLLRENVRDRDVVARFGGEEFVLAMPGITLVDAVSVCDRVRVAIADFPWQDTHPDLTVTTSVGVCDNPSAPNHDRLLIIADECLYRAKEGGKNCVCSQSD